MNRIAGFILAAAFVAGTLEGSRLPEPVDSQASRVARQTGQGEHRTGSGSDSEERSPQRDRVLA